MKLHLLLIVVAFCLFLESEAAAKAKIIKVLSANTALEPRDVTTTQTRSVRQKRFHTGGTISDSFQSQSEDLIETFTLAEGASPNYWANITYNMTEAATCVYTVTWRYSVAGVLHIWNFCVDGQTFSDFYDCMENPSWAPQTYKLTCFQILNATVGSRRRMVNADGDFVDDLKPHQRVNLEQLTKRFGEHRFYARDVSQMCAPDIRADCEHPVAYDPMDKQYDVDPNAEMPPFRLFQVSNLYLRSFGTTVPMIANINAHFTLARNLVVECELGFAVDGVVDEASVLTTSLNVPVNLQTVTLSYSKLLPAFDGHDIALAYRCSRDPREAEVYFGGNPTLSVDLENLVD